MSDGWEAKASDDELVELAARGPMHQRRTVGLVIPCQVASPQSLTPFHQTPTSVTRNMKTKRSNSDKVVVASSKAKSLKERPMNLLKYIGMDVHKAMTVIAILDSMGKQLAEAIIETKSTTILDFIRGQRSLQSG